MDAAANPIEPFTYRYTPVWNKIYYAYVIHARPSYTANFA